VVREYFKVYRSASLRTVNSLFVLNWWSQSLYHSDVCLLRVLAAAGGI